MDFSNTLFRCSSLGYIMTDPRSKSDTLSETCKTHLVDVYVSNQYNRQTDIQNKYIQKGLLVEEDSITLYSRVKKEFFKKNEEHINNDFIKGTPDLFSGESVRNADMVVDVKSSWDIFTFFRVHTKDVNSQYYWQLQGYMALTGAKTSKLAYCLIDTPELLISDEKRKLLWKMGSATEESPEFIEACLELDKLMRYDDIPLNERMIEFEIERNDGDINKLYDRVKLCRNYLCELKIKLSPEFNKMPF